jgi:hypothetical protein
VAGRGTSRDFRIGTSRRRREQVRDSHCGAGIRGDRLSGRAQVVRRRRRRTRKPRPRRPSAMGSGVTLTVSR